MKSPVFVNNNRRTGDTMPSLELIQPEYSCLVVTILKIHISFLITNYSRYN